MLKQPAPTAEKAPWPLWAHMLLAAAVVFALAWPSLILTRGPDRLAAIWPVNAALLTILLRSPPPRWPPLLAAGFVGNVLANLVCGGALTDGIVMTACNMVEVMVLAYGAARFAAPDLDLTQSRAFTVFAVLCGVGLTLSGAAFAFYVWLQGGQWLMHDALAWLMTDGLGLFVLTPAFLILASPDQRAVAITAFRSNRAKLPLLIFALLLVTSFLGPWHSFHLLAPPVVVMIALELELAGAAAAMLALTLFSIAMLLTGKPPALFDGTLTQQLLKIQFFLGVTAAVILPVGAAVSQRTRYRRDLASALKQAKEATAAKSEFLATMSHELRTPLTSIIGFSGLLREGEGLDETQSRYVRRIADASQALLSVINDVLDFSKLEMGEVELDPQPTSPQTLIRQTAGLVGLQAQSKGLELVIDLDPGLPDCVLVDDGRLGQILLNLLGNAVKFTSKGEVRVSAAWADGRLTVVVADTGPGIAAEHLDRLFQRFSQADSSVSRRFGGSGLGLAISRSLTELMGGAISVRTGEGEGSAFTFDVAAPRAVADAPQPRSAQLKAGQTRRVLIVDDAAANRELVRTLLESAGLSVSEARDGEAGVAAAAGERFDLILMDVRMPGMDGLTAARRLRSEPGPNRHTPILALTADVQPDDIEACRAAGMDDHIAKPVAVADLIGKAILWATPPGEPTGQGMQP